MFYEKLDEVLFMVSSETSADILPLLIIVLFFLFSSFVQKENHFGYKIKVLTTILFIQIFTCIK